MEQKTLTEKDLERLGFTCVENEMYVNKKQWLLQVSDDYVDTDNGEIISRDGTWFDAIGTWNFDKNGEMAVNTLCRGNYVCRSVKTVENLQLLFFALTGNKLELCKEFNFMDKKEIIALIKKVGQEQNGCTNSDGEYVDFCKGDEEYVFDNEDVNELAEKLIKLFSLHLVSKTK